MGWLLDILKEVPLSAVLKERVALEEQKYDQAVEEAQELRQRVAGLEREVADLRSLLPATPAGDLNDDTRRVLVLLFQAEDRDMHAEGLAQNLQLDRGVVQYHLDGLNARGLAEHAGSNYLDVDIYWKLTPEGRRYVVENGLLAE